MHLHGLRTVITGASAGLGRALALELTRRGARVALVARTAAPLLATAEDICTLGGEAHAIIADVGDKLAAHPIAGQCMAALGGVDLVVHNASTLGPVPLRALLDTDCEDIERTLAVNVLGPHRLNKLFVAPMVLQGRGAVISVSSDAAVEAYPQWGAYGLSKAALDHMTRVLAAETEGTGVRALSFDPGEMDTRMHADAMPDADRSSLARPESVAVRLVTLIERIEQFASGARVTASAEALS